MLLTWVIVGGAGENVEMQARVRGEARESKDCIINPIMHGKVQFM